MSWSSHKSSKEEQTRAVASGQKDKSWKFLPSKLSASNSSSFSSSSRLHDDSPANLLKYADRDITDIDSDGLCQTCSSIPWQRLPNSMVNGKSILPKIYHTTRALQTSACRVCRFLGDVIVSTELILFNSEPPYQLELCGYTSAADETIGVLRFTKTHPSNLWPSGKDSHIIVTQKPSILKKPPSKNLLLGGCPLELIRMKISECEMNHVDSCSLFRSDTLRALKVLDCERKEIVSAPPGCRYVALSYVWGPRQSLDNFDDVSKLDVLPKTVSDSCLVARSLGYKYLWVDRYVSNLRSKSTQPTSAYSV
jgi:hypothetical protein